MSQTRKSSWSTISFSGIVLAGGSSRRMGTDKALLDVRGEPLVLTPHRALVAAGATDVIVVGGDGAALSALGLDVRPDQWPGEGPLAGLVSGLVAVAEDVAVVLACDLPGACVDLVDNLVDAFGGSNLEAAEIDAVVPVVDGRRQPLAALYRLAAAPEMQSAFDTGERSLLAALDRLRVHEIELPDPRWVLDVDTPKDVDDLRGQ
jgi:molybdopterin-guanine dinucleotide biosynthesis protein A